METIFHIILRVKTDTRQPEPRQLFKSDQKKLVQPGSLVTYILGSIWLSSGPKQDYVGVSGHSAPKLCRTFSTLALLLVVQHISGLQVKLYTD